MESPILSSEIQEKNNQLFFRATGALGAIACASATAFFMHSAGYSLLAIIGASIAAGAAGLFIIPPIAFVATQIFIALPFVILFGACAGGYLLLTKNCEVIKNCFGQYEKA